MTRKVSAIIMAMILLLAVVTSGCSNDSDEEITEVDPNIQAALKVMHFNEKHFHNTYGNFFTAKFPNVEIEVISTQYLFSVPPERQKEAFMEMIKEKQPDVIMLEVSQMEELVQEDALYRLDAVIKRDNFDIENILPAVTEKIKEAGGGSLYGLAPRFNSNALFYNIDLFNQYNIELPRDRMTWDEVFELAQRFPTSGSESERIYGFANSNTMDDSVASTIFTLGMTEGLSYVSSDAKKVSMDSEQWRGIMERVVKAYKSGAINTSSDQGANDLFIGNRIAMRYEGSFYLSQITYQDNKKGKPLNWGIVTVPVDPSNPNMTGPLSISDLFGINAASPNKSLAWEFIKLANSEQVAKALSKTLDLSLSTRPAFVTDMNGKQLDAFYALGVSGERSQRYDKLPRGFNMSSIIQKAISGVIADEHTLDEAVNMIQELGNGLLTRLYEKQEQEKSEAK